MVRVALVGGPEDGRVIEFEGHTPTEYVYVAIDVRGTPLGVVTTDDDLPVSEASFPIARYRRERSTRPGLPRWRFVYLGTSS